MEKGIRKVVTVSVLDVETGSIERNEEFFVRENEMVIIWRGDDILMEVSGHDRSLK
jgi:hypothetical protein